jgi:phosphate transport system substrate-binding protein
MIKIPTAVFLALLTAALGCGGEQRQSGPASEATLQGLVKVDGSSTVFPITEAVAEEFQKKNREVKVTVGISGTGGGFKKFCGGETDITDASRPIKPSEVELCGKNGIAYIELPIAYDGIAVVIHPTNTWAESMTVAELKKMWEPQAQAKVTRWNQVRQGWPNRELHLYGAGVDSGTYDYFTEAIVKKEHASRGDYTSSEDDNVIVQGVASDPLALAFFGYAYFHENQGRLKAMTIDDQNPANGAGPIAPSPETIMNGTYQPLARPVFIYVSARALDRPEVRAFVDFYLTHAPELTAEVGYVALPPRAYELAATRVESRKTGSMFGGEGSKVGVSIEQLLQAEQAEQPSAPSP